MTSLLIYIFLASFLTAVANYFIRKSTDLSPGNGDPFLVHRFLSAAIFPLGISLYRNGTFVFELNTVLLGVFTGFLLGLLMWSIGRSVRNGSPGLSFTCASASCVLPPLFMSLLFGKEFGHEFSFKHLVGSILVLLGLSWMAFQQIHTLQGSTKKKWVVWTSAAFLLNAIYLTLFQWRALLIRTDLPDSTFIPFLCDPNKSECFMVAMYGSAIISQFVLPGSVSCLTFTPSAFRFGWMGGLINGVSGYFLMRSTEIAGCGPGNAIVIPLFSIALIFFCNCWGQWLYKEKVNWIANALCFMGIFIALFS